LEKIRLQLHNREANGARFGKGGFAPRKYRKVPHDGTEDVGGRYAFIFHILTAAKMSVDG
jgi:hypothetical protein